MPKGVKEAKTGYMHSYYTQGIPLPPYHPGYTPSTTGRTCRTAAAHRRGEVAALTLRVAELTITDEPLTVMVNTVRHGQHCPSWLRRGSGTGRGSLVREEALWYGKRLIGVTEETHRCDGSVSHRCDGSVSHRGVQALIGCTGSSHRGEQREDRMNNG